MNHWLVLVIVVAGCSTFLGGCKKPKSDSVPPFMTKPLPVNVTSPEDAAAQFVKASDRDDKPMIFSLLTPAAQAKSGYVGLLHDQPPKEAPNFKRSYSSVQKTILGPDGQTAHVTAKIGSYRSPFTYDAFILVHNTPNGWRVSGMAYSLADRSERVDDYENPKFLSEEDINRMRGESFRQVFGQH
jgi:hypothetical protein